MAIRRDRKTMQFTRGRSAGARARRLLASLSVALAMTAMAAAARAESPTPGGFVEQATGGQVRARVMPPLPARGPFTFPAPYNTTGVRLTNARDCGGGDCVNYVGYSYWRNTNNHVGSDTMLIFLSLDRARGGKGPTLLRYDKTTDQVAVVGPMFDAQHPLSWATGEGWYWSGSQANKLYVNQGAKLLRYDVMARTFETVFDAAPRFGDDKYIWQIHSSGDDRMHSATLRTTAGYTTLGCVVYDATTTQLSFFPSKGAYDECQIDESGRWLVIKENVDGRAGEDNVIIDLQGGGERVFADEAGAGGHSDTGYGYMVAADNWNNLPGVIRVWTLGAGSSAEAAGRLVYRTTDWASEISHVSHRNARPGIPASQQYACGSGASRLERPHANEILCFPLDGSLRVLVVAPVLTDLDAPGGGNDYAKLPKGNLDLTGRYFIWTGNAGGNRLDAFIVKVPAELLSMTATGSEPVSAGPSLAAAVLPGSRSVQVGSTAVALATVINVGSVPGRQCGVSAAADLPARFTFQATDPVTNLPAGAANSLVEIEPGAARTFMIGVTAAAPMSTRDVGLTFRCASGEAAPSRPNLNTLTMSASSAPVPDIVALSATVSGDGIVDVPGTDGAAAFAVGAANLGAGAVITASVDKGSAIQPLTLSLCQSSAVTGQCSSQSGSSVRVRIDAGETASFAVFVQGHGDVPFDPANGRIVVRFTDDDGVIRGATSVAVRTR